MALNLKQQLAGEQIVLAPGVYDGLSASVAQSCGATALYLSGASVAYTRLGLPDIGLVSVSELASTLSMICDRVELPVIVDADTGFGNALNAARTLRELERSGAAAVQFEDQTLPKRCGHLRGKTLVSRAEMVGKLQAVLDARRNEQTLIVARTDAIAVEGLDAALDRAEAYLQVGADILFIEAPRDLEQMQLIQQRFARRVPLLANMVEGGSTPLKSAAQLQELGYSLVIFPGALVRALVPVMQNFYSKLLQQGSSSAMIDSMLDLTQLNTLLGTEEILALGERYAAGESGND